jgi:hypothetical protein
MANFDGRRHGTRLGAQRRTVLPEWRQDDGRGEGHYATYQTLPSYDVTPDGQRFLLTKTAEQGQQEISVVLNWFEELKQKVPTGKK